MSVENIKNPSVTEDALALGLDSSGNIVSISGHYLAGGGGGGSISYSGRNGVSINGSYIELETSSKNAVDAVAGISTDVGTLKNASAGWDKVSDKLDTTAFSNVSGTFLTAIPNTYALKTDIPTKVTQLTDSGNYYLKTETSSTGELDTAFGNKQDNLTQEQLSAISSVSSIKGTILTGDSNILATSAEDGNNIKWTLQLTAQPVVTDTTLSGYAGIVATKDSSVTSQWNVGIAQAYKEQIEAVSSKLTKSSADTLYAPNSVTGDVDTLKSSSGDWDKVSDKLDTTAFSDVSGSFLTAHQSLANYYTKTQVDSTFASATQLNDYLTTAQYQTNSATFALKTETSSKTEITNALNTKLDSTAADQTYQTISDMANYLTTSDAADTYQPKGNYAPESVTATVNTLTAASARWDEVSAKLGTAQYANDSATFVTKPDTTQTVLNNNYLIYSTLTDPTATTGWMPLSANYYSKTEADGRYQKKTDMSSYLTTAQYETDSATFYTTSNPAGYLTKTVADTYYQPSGYYATSAGLTAGNQYAMTTTGWAKVSTPTIPDITANNGISANGHTIGIDNTNLVANTKYAWTTTGWNDIGLSSYLPLSGGTVSGQLEISGSSNNFDSQFLKLTRENVNGYGRIGLGSSGPLALKVDDANSHTTQINISPNTTNDQLVQVQHGGTTAYLIPAVTSLTTAGLTNDGILHIILES